MPKWPVKAVSESLPLRALTALLCGIRLADPSVVYALLNVVSGYHDTLLSKHLDPKLSLPPHPFAQVSTVQTSNDKDATSTKSEGSKAAASPSALSPQSARLMPILPPPSDQVRYTRYWTQRSPTYRKASRILVTISYIQLLIEMLARKRSDRYRWKAVLALESVK